MGPLSLVHISPGQSAMNRKRGLIFWIPNARILFMLLLLWCACSPVSAQTFFGSIVGRVSDNDGAVIGGASVTLTSRVTAERQKITTDSDGNYRFVSLVPAAYQIEVESAGFKHFTQGPINVRVDTTVRIDVTLVAGDVSERVEVKGQTPLLDTQG